MTLETHQHPNPIMPEKTIHDWELSDKESKYIRNVGERYGFEIDHHPESPEDIYTCNSLANKGVFIKNHNRSYTVTHAGKNISHEAGDSEKTH